MLGIKSNREPIKGVFAKKLREQISCDSSKTTQTQVQVHANTSDEMKK
jgi:hypothetical protein